MLTPVDGIGTDVTVAFVYVGRPVFVPMRDFPGKSPLAVASISSSARSM
jgi:hypothetical protein